MKTNVFLIAVISFMEVKGLAIIAVKSLLEAGVHFGHRLSRWNPKMAPYIFGKRNLIHIINLRETVKGLIKAYHFLNKITSMGEEVIFVGTKRQARGVIKKLAEQCGMHYVSERWLGGTLTNFMTIRKRLERLDDLDRMDKDGSIENFGKKMASSLRREKRKIDRNLQGIKLMSKLPGALIIVDPKKEYNAVKEAAKLGIPTIALIDTDSDPDMLDIIIPGNDDAMRSIEVICSKLADAITAGKTEWKENQKAQKKLEESAAQALIASGAQLPTFEKDGEGSEKFSKRGDKRPKKEGAVKEGLPKDNKRGSGSGGRGGGRGRDGGYYPKHRHRDSDSEMPPREKKGFAPKPGDAGMENRGNSGSKPNTGTNAPKPAEQAPQAPQAPQKPEGSGN